MKQLLSWSSPLVVLVAVAAGCANKPADSGALPAVRSADPASAVDAQSYLAPTPSDQSGGLVPAVVGSPPSAVDAPTYRIGPSDVLKITVFQVADLSTEERVSDAGTIVLPLIGVVHVAGLTPAQAETKIASALAQEYLHNPQVDVFVSEQANMKVSVGGAVQSPGVFPMSGNMTLLNAIAQAGGVTHAAKKKEVVIFRTTPTGDMKAYIVNLNEVQRGESMDPVLAGNDKVIVPESGSIVLLKGVSDTLRGFVRLPVIGF